MSKKKNKKQTPKKPADKIKQIIEQKKKQPVDYNRLLLASIAIVIALIICIVIIALITSSSSNDVCINHEDIDTNGYCDKCGAKLFSDPVIKPDDDTTNSGGNNGGTDIEPDPVDITKSPEMATEKLNSLIKNTNIDVQIEFINFLNNATFYNNDFKSINSVTFNSKKAIMQYTDVNDAVHNRYFWYQNVSSYMIDSNGETCNGARETISGDLFYISSLPTFSAGNVIYNENKGCFELESEYIDYILYLKRPNYTETPNGEMETIMHSLYDLYYTVEFKLDASNTITEVSVVGRTSDSLESDTVFKFTYKVNSSNTVMTLNINSTITVNATYTITNTNELAAHIETSSKFSEEYNRSVDFTATVDTKKNVSFPSDILVEFERLQKSNGEYVSPETIYEKYGYEYQLDGNSCPNIVIYDQDYGVYVYFERCDGVYSCIGFDYDKDNNTYCFAQMIDNTLYIDKHCTAENGPTTIEEKYAGPFTVSNADCPKIVVYDSQFDTYVLFSAKTTVPGEYIFKGTLNYAWENYCIGTVDVYTKTIKVTKHTNLDELLAALNGKLFDATNAADCYEINVYYEEYEAYLVFGREGDKWKYVGGSMWGANCMGDINFDTLTLKTWYHEH